MSLRRRAFGLFAAALMAASGSVAPAQELAGGYYSRERAYSAWAAGPPEPQGEVVRVDLTAAGASQILNLPRGKSAIVELPVDVRDVLVTSPTVADAVIRSPRRIYVLGLAPGQTDAAFFDASGRRLLSLNIRVDQDTQALADTISRLVPGSNVRVEGVNQSIVLAGKVANAADADRVQRLAASFVERPEQVVNMLSIDGGEQVMLQVRIVEMQRNVIKQLGFNLGATLNQVGEPQYLFNSAASFAVNGGLLGGASGGFNLDTTRQPVLSDPDNEEIRYVVRGGSPNADTATVFETAGDPGLNKANSTLQAFERVGLVRTLAEPNLTAISGEPAKFLAGGEYPVPVGQDNTGRTTIEFKPYGVGLGFTPLVLSDGRISLKISTEVSELSTQGAFTLNQGSGANASTLTIPALTVRRAETTVELPSGGAMMIAGLLQERTRQNIDSLPGMMNLPILGALFRSRDYQSGETELVVIVTPYLVKPTTPDRLRTPVDGLRTAGDLETMLLGKLNKTYKGQPAPQGRTYQGPYGYVIE